VRCFPRRHRSHLGSYSPGSTVGPCFSVTVVGRDIKLSSPVDLLSRRVSLVRLYSGAGNIEVRNTSRSAPANLSRPVAARLVDTRHYTGKEKRIPLRQRGACGSIL
jgi:hypothetical protein